jgi:hypothetical protein
MTLVLISKIKFYNGKKALFILFFCAFYCYGYCQSKKVKEAIKKQEQRQEKKDQSSDDQYEGKLKHQFEIQSKIAQTRMLQNKKVTDKYYKKKLGQTFFQRICPKKRKM